MAEVEDDAHTSGARPKLASAARERRQRLAVALSKLPPEIVEQRNALHRHLGGVHQPENIEGLDSAILGLYQYVKQHGLHIERLLTSDHTGEAQALRNLVVAARTKTGRQIAFKATTDPSAPREFTWLEDYFQRGLPVARPLDFITVEIDGTPVHLLSAELYEEKAPLPQVVPIEHWVTAERVAHHMGRLLDRFHRETLTEHTDTTPAIDDFVSDVEYVHEQYGYLLDHERQYNRAFAVQSLRQLPRMLTSTTLGHGDGFPQNVLGRTTHVHPCNN
jgi:hypothetical protein